MPIQVICPGCQARFSVSDQFSGRSGPCPKCKQPIKIPAKIQSIQIHEPEAPTTTSKGTGRAPTAPIRRVDKPIAPLVIVAIAVGTLMLMVLALLAQWVCGAAIPFWLMALAALGIALPCVRMGYEILREKELDPYRGRSLLMRTLICASVYAVLWGVRWLLPAEVTAEMWQWLYIAPIFFFAGSVAAQATLDLDWGPGAVHYSLYILVTTLLRWLAGLPPI